MLAVYTPVKMNNWTCSMNLLSALISALSAFHLVLSSKKDMFPSATQLLPLTNFQSLYTDSSVRSHVSPSLTPLSLAVELINNLYRFIWLSPEGFKIHKISSICPLPPVSPCLQTNRQVQKQDKSRSYVKTLSCENTFAASERAFLETRRLYSPRGVQSRMRVFFPVWEVLN